VQFSPRELVGFFCVGRVAAAGFLFHVFFFNTDLYWFDSHPTLFVRALFCGALVLCQLPPAYVRFLRPAFFLSFCFFSRTAAFPRIGFGLVLLRPATPFLCLKIFFLGTALGVLLLFFLMSFSAGPGRFYSSRCGDEHLFFCPPVSIPFDSGSFVLPTFLTPCSFSTFF